MTRIKSIKDIGLVYESMLAEKQQQNQVIEEKKNQTLPTFPQAKDKKIDTKKITAKGSDKKAFALKNTGPEAAEGFSKDIVDPKTAKKDNHFEPQKFSTALEKKEPANINNNMSKSIFDKLYEDVMKDDALDLGIQAGPEGDALDKAGDVGGESEDVTVTLPRDVAQKLHDLLHDILGTEEDHSGEEDLGDDTEEKPEDEQAPVAAAEDEQSKAKKEDKKEDEDQEEVAGEATELEELPDSKGQSLQGKNNKVAGKLGHAKGGKASGDIKATNDGKLTALPDSKGHTLTNKNNKVNAAGYKAGEFFK